MGGIHLCTLACLMHQHNYVHTGIVSIHNETAMFGQDMEDNSPHSKNEKHLESA